MAPLQAANQELKLSWLSDGPTIGILRYEGPVVVVHVLKLIRSHISGVKMTLGPMAIKVDKASLRSEKLEDMDDYHLPFIPQDSNGGAIYR